MALRQAKQPKITVHRDTEPVAPGSRVTYTRWLIRIDGEHFATIHSIGAVFGSWSCHIDNPRVTSGSFYDKQGARAWALEMAQRKVDPSRGPIVSIKDNYGYERRIEHGA